MPVNWGETPGFMKLRS